MEPFTTLTAVAAPIDLPNVDTDRIVPARFLRKPRSPEYARYLFHDVRFDAAGAERPDFVLNQPPYRAARILVTAENFACGSSREMAVWTLAEAGIRAVVGPSFGDIFFNNCFRNGVLPVVVPAAVAADVRARLHAAPGARMTVDLEAQVVVGPDGTRHPFEIDPFRKQMLRTGGDEIALTLGHEAAIAAHEAGARRELGWLLVPGRQGDR